MRLLQARSSSFLLLIFALARALFAPIFTPLGALLPLLRLRARTAQLLRWLLLHLPWCTPGLCSFRCGGAAFFAGLGHRLFLAEVRQGPFHRGGAWWLRPRRLHRLGGAWAAFERRGGGVALRARCGFLLRCRWAFTRQRRAFALFYRAC